MAMVRVRYFAAARELASTSEEELELPEAHLSAERLVEWLGERHPRLAPYASRMRLAINGELAAATGRVSAGDAVYVLPPVAGGSGPYVAIREAALSVDECMRAVADPSAGGIAVFAGVVRDHADGKAVARLDYEAHADLATREMGRILEEIAAEMPGVRLAASHRVGRLDVGDLAVVIAASAPHRAEAFAACRLAIDRIKESVPIWKKEWAPDGTAHWVNLES